MRERERVRGRERKGARGKSDRERKSDGELSQHMNTRYELSKRNHSQQQQNCILLIHKFEKLSIYEMNKESLSKTLKESIDPKGIIFPPIPFIY